MTPDLIIIDDIGSVDWELLHQAVKKLEGCGVIIAVPSSQFPPAPQLGAELAMLKAKIIDAAMAPAAPPWSRKAGWRKPWR